jgi:secreted trypsin-like serine protease
MKASRLHYALIACCALWHNLGACALPDDEALDHDPLGVEIDEIIGGVDTTIGANPWHSTLAGVGIPFQCDGAIVSANWVLSAKQCIDVMGLRFSVISGATTLLDTSKQSRGVVAVVPVPQVAGSPLGDLVLLRLSSPLNLAGTTTRAIPLVTPAEATAGVTNPNVVARLTGRHGQGVSLPLRSVDVPIIPNATASAAYGTTIPAHELATGGGAKGACMQDTGGPLTVLVAGVRKLAGIAKARNDCASASRPGLYTRISSFQSWISPRIGGRFVFLHNLANLSGSAGSFVHRAVQVPAGTLSLNVVTNFANGNPDVYVRFGSAPTTATFACRSTLGELGGDHCTIHNPAPGTWFVSLRGATAYSGASLFTTIVTP